MLATLLCATAVVILDQSSLIAQQDPTVDVGSRVRVTVPEMGIATSVGTVRGVGRDSVLVEFEYPRRTLALERTAMTGLDVSVARHRKTLKGLGMGLLIGAGTGAVLGLASGDDPSDQWFAFSAEEKAALLGVTMGLTGGLIGVIAGALSRTDVWSPVTPAPSSPPFDVGLAPFTTDVGTGMHLALSLHVR